MSAKPCSSYKNSELVLRDANLISKLLLYHTVFSRCTYVYVKASTFLELMTSQECEGAIKCGRVNMGDNVEGRALAAVHNPTTVVYSRETVSRGCNEIRTKYQSQSLAAFKILINSNSWVPTQLTP